MQRATQAHESEEEGAVAMIGKIGEAGDRVEGERGELANV